jgi:hypothetical protein
MFKDNTNVVPTIQPLNEPAGFDGDSVLTPLRQFYYDSYGNVRFPYGSAQQSNTVLMIHDAFQDSSYWSGFMHEPQWQGVILDTHVRTGHPWCCAAMLSGVRADLPGLLGRGQRDELGPAHPERMLPW